MNLRPENFIDGLQLIQYRSEARRKRAELLQEVRSAPELDAAKKRKFRKAWNRQEPAPRKPTVSELRKEAASELRAARDSANYARRGGINHLPCGSDDAWMERNIDGRENYARALKAAAIIIRACPQWEDDIDTRRIRELK